MDKELLADENQNAASDMLLPDAGRDRMESFEIPLARFPVPICHLSYQMHTEGHELLLGDIQLQNTVPTELNANREGYLHTKHHHRLQSACDLLPEMGCWKRASPRARMSSGEVSSIEVVYDKDPSDVLTNAIEVSPVHSRISRQNKKSNGYFCQSNLLLDQNSGMDLHATDLTGGGERSTGMASESTPGSVNEHPNSSDHAHSLFQERELTCVPSSGKEQRDSLVVESCPIIMENDKTSGPCDGQKYYMGCYSVQEATGVDQVCLNCFEHSTVLRNTILFDIKLVCSPVSWLGEVSSGSYETCVWFFWPTNRIVHMTFCYQSLNMWIQHKLELDSKEPSHSTSCWCNKA